MQNAIVDRESFTDHSSLDLHAEARQCCHLKTPFLSWNCSCFQSACSKLNPEGSCWKLMACFPSYSNTETTTEQRPRTNKLEQAKPSLLLLSHSECRKESPGGDEGREKSSLLPTYKNSRDKVTEESVLLATSKWV